MSLHRNFAVGIVVSHRITSIVERRVSIREAVAFTRSYNRFDPDRQAVILVYPISRAISQAKIKSRSS